MTKLFYFLFSLCLLAACSPAEQEENMRPIDEKKLKEDLIKQNQIWHKQEIMDIEDYVKRHNWKMTASGTGLLYLVYKKVDTTKAPRAKDGNIVVINYSVSLLNDSICYSSEGDPDEFLIGMDNVESGLHEGMTYLHKGEKAKIILPSNLAFGLVGDMEKIPPQSPLIYDIELVDILDGETKKPVVHEKK